MATEREFLASEVTELDAPIADADAFICEIVRLVADATETDPLALPPLFDAVDPEAVQGVLRSGQANGAKVSFRYAGCEVVVTSDGVMSVLDEPSTKG